MGIEIERKFLVKSDGWRKLGCAVRYAQGYLCSDRNRTVRVRTVGDKGFLTVKGRGSGIAHPEYEYEIPPKSRTGWLYNQPVPYFLRVAAR